MTSPIDTLRVLRRLEASSKMNNIVTRLLLLPDSIRPGDTLHLLDEIDKLINDITTTTAMRRE